MKENEVNENPMPTGLVKMDEPTALTRSGGPQQVFSLIQKIVDAGITTDSTAALKEMQLMYEHSEDRDAKRQWIAAFSRAQAALKTIIANKIVPTKAGGVMYKTAPLEDVLDNVEPIIQPEGLRLRFDSKREGNILTVFCHVMHEAGHEEVSRCAINCADAKGGDLGAVTSGKRGSLMEMFALKIRGDDDARMLGDLIKPDQLQALQAKINEAGIGDLKPFLAFAQATELSNIRQGKLSVLYASLQKKIDARKPKPETPASSVPTPAEQAAIAEREAREAERK
jgi:hypothetical protein